ncbi:hypothetical protein EG329_006098, partial [Mollisiaceae sp. DMI_Dod_QoI]
MAPNNDDCSKKLNKETEAFEQKAQAIFHPRPRLSLNTSNLQVPSFNEPQPSSSQSNMQPTMAPQDQSPHPSLDSTLPDALSPFSHSNDTTPHAAERGSSSPNIIFASPSFFTDAPPGSNTTDPQRSPLPPSFPFHQPPQSIRIRLTNQKSALQVLDKEYNEKEHPLVENERIRGMGAVKDEKGEVALGLGFSFEEAAMALRDHHRERLPYAQLASSRLQAVMGERNELAFDLPKPMKPIVSPQFQAVFEAERFVGPKFGAGLELRTGARVNVGLGLDVDPLGLAKLRKERGIDVGSKAETGNSNPLGPPISAPFTPFDPKTGKGLRHWLMKVGKENGTLKRKPCKSISFHDFTADMKTGAFSNVLVLHYNDEGPDQIVEVYEVSLPTSSFNEKTRREAITYQKWIWFFIARPVITFNKNKSVQSHHSSESSLSSPEDNFYTPLSDMRSPIDLPEPSSKPPPNFPDPIPVAWMIFASPIDHLTTYPTQVENIIVKDPSNGAHTTNRYGDENQPPSPNLRIPAKRSNPFTQPSSSKLPNAKRMTHKRTDYDFSHQGLPLFEFSNATSSTFPLSPSFSDNDPSSFRTGDWLSVPDMPAFISPFIPPYLPFVSGLRRSRYEFELKDKDEYQREKEDWMRGLGKGEKKLTKEEKSKDEL